MELPDFGPYTVEDLNALIRAAQAALISKETMASAEAKINEILADVKAAQGVTDGEDWTQPTGAQDAYPLGARVAHGGKVWENLTTANVWEPGVSGWREFVDASTIADWIQPTGSHDVYNLGDKVKYAGKVWRSTIAANVWAPGVHGWEEVAEA